MTPQLIPLNLIDPNPWQPRTSTDPEHVAKIALSIARQGLLQTPTARAMPDGRYQLAFGHTRRAAFQLLAESPELADERAAALAAGRTFDAMPLNIADLTDEEMCRQAVSENVARRDLNPLDEAAAMQRYQTEFGKTSEQVGELFGLSGSAVRNKLRLLALPEAIRAQAANLPERTLRALIPLVEFPAAKHVRLATLSTTGFRNRAAESMHYDTVLQAALTGELTSEQIAERVKEFWGACFLSLDAAGWGHEQVHPGVGYQHPTCKGCQYRQQNAGSWYCTQPGGECYQQRQTVSRRIYMQQAADRAGVPVVERDTSWYYPGSSWEKIVKTQNCPNLRVQWSADPMPGENANVSYFQYPMRVENYPHAQYICKNGSACACLRAANGAPAPVSLEAAKQINRDNLERKRHIHAQALDYLDQGAFALGQAMSRGVTDSVPLRALLYMLDFAQFRDLSSKGLLQSANLVCFGIARAMLRKEIPAPAGEVYTNSAAVWQQVNALLRIAGAPEIPAPAQTPAQELVPAAAVMPAGKTLADIFMAEEG